MYDDILYPSDFSKPSRVALPVAIDLCRILELKLTAFHGKVRSAEEHEYSDLETVNILTREAGVPFAIEYDSGDDVADLVVKRCRSKPPLLCVMGTHGRRPLAKWMMASITEQVMRHSQRPLVLVPPHVADRKWEGIRTILVGIDFSLPSRHALAWASVISRKSSATVHVMHTIESGVLTGTPFEFPSMKELIPNAQQTVMEAFKNFDSNILFPTVPHHHVATGVAHKEIVKLALTIPADLLILGPHGSGGMKDLLIGSTTDRVVRMSPCPVFIAKGAPPAEYHNT